MLSQSAEYLLRVVGFLACAGDKPATTEQIAAATLVPPGYLAKLLQGLVRAGMVDSRRGLHGGFVLLRSPHELSVYDVISVAGPLQRIRSCPLGLESHKTRLCPLHRRLDQVMAQAEEAFRSWTIAELIEGTAQSRPFRSPQTAALRKARSRRPRRRGAS
jgi:Rrf2 family nitric oxide-sensitive transcriptional repressor